MAGNMTTADKIYDKRNKEAVTEEAAAGEKSKTGSHLSAMEKITFGIAAVTSTAILIACVFLTIMGFIFSPLADTLVFGLLMGATGVTTYVIWRGGH